MQGFTLAGVPAAALAYMVVFIKKIYFRKIKTLSHQSEKRVETNDIKLTFFSFADYQTVVAMYTNPFISIASLIQNGLPGI